MTYEETKKLLEEMRYAKRRVNIQQRRLLEYKENYDSLLLHSCLGSEVQGTSRGSTIEKIIERLEAAQESIAKELEEFFAIEDKFTEAVNSLAPIDRDIIMEFYWADKRIWEITNDCGYSEETIKRHKRRAIKKIYEKMQNDTP